MNEKSNNLLALSLDLTKKKDGSFVFNTMATEISNFIF